MKEVRMPLEDYEKMQKEIQDLKKEVSLHRGNIPTIIIHHRGYSFSAPEILELNEAQKEIKNIIEENTQLNRALQDKKIEVNSLNSRIKYFNTLTLWERINYNPKNYTNQDYL